MSTDKQKKRAPALRCARLVGGRPTSVGWWEEYECGCTSETVRLKRELLGYCRFHGDSRRRAFREIKTPNNEVCRVAADSKSNSEKP